MGASGINWITIWLILLVGFIVIELATMGLTTIWFAGGAVAGAVCAAVQLPLAAQVVAFLAVSVLLLFFTRPIAVKHFNRNRAKTNVESLVGRQAIVINDIDNLQGVGQVKLGDMEWMARNYDGEEVIPAGSVVTVEEVEGVKLMVRLRQK